MLNKLIQKNFLKPICILGVGVVFVAVGMSAYAGGFQLFESSVKSLGNAFSGTSAIAQDASTEFYNPAGLTRLKHPELSVDGTLVDLETQGTVTATTKTDSLGLPPPLNNTFAVQGNSNVSPGGLDFIPSFHAAYPINDRFALGFGVDVPFGLETDYSSDSVVRFLATESKLEVVSIGPSLGIQVTPKLSLGLGAGAEYMSAILDQYAPTTYIPDPPVINETEQAEFNNEGDSWAFVWDVGALYQFTPNTRLGIAYHSEAHHHLKGDASIKGTIGIFPKVNFDTSGHVKTDVTLPDSLNISLYHKINPEFAVMAGFTWTDWSVLNSVTLNYSGDLANGTNNTNPINIHSATLKLNFKDTYRVSVGGDFMPNKHWTFRTGLAWDESPVRGASSRTLRLPDANRFWIAFGASYKFDKHWVADFGYSHLFISQSEVHRLQTYNVSIVAQGPAVLTETADGDFRDSANEYGLGLNYIFA